MKTKAIKIAVVLFTSILISCVGQNETAVAQEPEIEKIEVEPTKSEPHRYGGWYCPDNLNGFPAVDINSWKDVPVVNDRLPSEEEARNGSSLIFVDTVQYPDAKVLDIEMPKLARFYNENAQREDLIIVIQAFNVGTDSIIGFRYLNGGNGSARISEADFLSDSEIAAFPELKFVTQTIELKATQREVWEVLTNPEYEEKLHSTYDPNNELDANWRERSNVNYHYQHAGNLSAPYANKLFGNYYIQNDYDQLWYTEKFFLLEDMKAGTTELRVVTGPFIDDLEYQENCIKNWLKKVKELSEC